MEPITEEDTPPNSAHSLGDELTRASESIITTQANSQSDTSITETQCQTAQD